MTVTIYHNPQCSNSRRALEVIRAHGIEPEIVEYVKTPLSREAVAGLVTKLGVPVREVMRTKEAAYAELKLDAADDAALLDAIAAHPVLLNRPIVVVGAASDSVAPRARLCRPGDTVSQLL